MAWFTTYGQIAAQIANLRTDVLSAIANLKKEMEMDFSNANAALAALKTDFSKFATDATAKLTALAANQQNPADAQSLTDLASGIQELDKQVQAADAALNPPPPPPPAGTQA